MCFKNDIGKMENEVEKYWEYDLEIEILIYNYF